MNKGVTVVNNVAKARHALSVLNSLPKTAFHACDTEVAFINVKKQSPVGNGKVICLSVFSGPDVDFGDGPRLWIDNYGEAEVRGFYEKPLYLLVSCFTVDDPFPLLFRTQGTLHYFKDWLEDHERLKVWHNYGFDRHVLFNHNINVLGLGGDTMHMARLWDSARPKKGGYSLETLSADLLGKR